MLSCRGDTDNLLPSFGFRDGVSQPLLEGIDTDEAFKRAPSMKTPQRVVTVTDDPPSPQDGVDADPQERPAWMIEGSFLVFRKLEQDVQAFIDLTGNFASGACTSADQCGAKLMGRWKSGMHHHFPLAIQSMANETIRCAYCIIP